MISPHENCFLFEKVLSWGNYYILFMDSQKQKFEKENGMSVDDAFEMVKKWHGEGKEEEAKKGCEEIFRFFPDHEGAHALFPVSKEAEVREQGDPKKEEIQGEEEFSPEELSPQKEEKKAGVLDGLKKEFSHQKEKFKELSTSKGSQNSLPEMDSIKDEDRILAAFGYAWYFAIIPLFLKRDSAFIQFHAWQGIVLTVFFTLLNIIFLGALAFVFSGFIHFILTMIAVFIYAASAYAAYKGKWFKIPIIHSFSEKLQKLFSA